MDYASSRLVTDVAGLDKLKAQARSDRTAAAGEVAKQFEGLLVQMMIKSMRQASLGQGALDSQQSLFYRDMYDQQLAQQIAGRGLGLAEVLKRQLGGDAADKTAETPAGRDLASYLANRVQGVAAQRTSSAADQGNDSPEATAGKGDAAQSIAASQPKASRGGGGATWIRSSSS
jgi:flagellar protein FlgJ